MQLLASEEKFSALAAIFGKSSCPELAAEAHTAVSYHNRTPSFAEEWKVRLPNRINKQTHLLFTFIHVHTKQKGGGGGVLDKVGGAADKGGSAGGSSGVEEVVGYTWLPLWRDDRLQTGTFSLPVLAEAPSAGYSFLSPTTGDSLGPGFKWIDSHRPLFTVHLEAYSSIFAQDAAVDRFFRISASLDSQAHVASYLHSANFVEEFSRAISGLVGAGTDSLVKFVHLILNRLLLLMVRPPQIFANSGNGKGSGGKSNHHAHAHHSIKAFQTLVFETVVAIVGKINGALYYVGELPGRTAAARTGVLATYIHYQAVFPQPEVRFTSSNSAENRSSYQQLVQHNHHHHHHHRFSGLLHGSESSDNGHFVSRTFHEELLQQWLNCSSGSSGSNSSSSTSNGSSGSPGNEMPAVREKLYENASFFFDALFRSLCVHLSLNGGFLLPPRKRLSKGFLLSLEELGRTIGEYVFGELKQRTSCTGNADTAGNGNGDYHPDSSSATSPTSPTTPNALHNTSHLLQNLNTAYAFFLRDLLSVADRNYVLNCLVKGYIRKLCSVSAPQHSQTSNGGNSGITTSTASFGYSTVSAEASLNSARQLADGLFELRVDFLRVLAGHEHFVALNLPFGTPLFSALEQTMLEGGCGGGNLHGNYHNSSSHFSPSSSFAKAMLNSSLFSHSIFDRIRPYAELTDDYRRQHWPLGLVFCTLVDGFTRAKAGLQLKAANLLRALMTAHDWDRRYKGLYKCFL